MTRGFFITRDNNEHAEHVIWPDAATLEIDDSGTWWDEKCRYRGEPIGGNVVETLLGAFLLKGKMVMITVTCDPAPGTTRT